MGGQRFRTAQIGVRLSVDPLPSVTGRAFKVEVGTVPHEIHFTVDVVVEHLAARRTKGKTKSIIAFAEILNLELRAVT